MKTVTLSYPDQTSNERILSDLTELSRSYGEPGLGATAQFDYDDPRFEGLAAKLDLRRVKHSDLPAADPAVAQVNDGDQLTIGDDTFAFEVANSAITGIVVT